jgi:hypothetical protein
VRRAEAAVHKELFMPSTRSIARLAAGALLLLTGIAHATVLPVPMYPQQTNMWCWAASGQMIMTYLGAPAVSQCHQANVELNRSDCCNSPTPAACVQGGYTQFDRYNFSVTYYPGGALPFNMLANEINNNRPVEFAWSWTGGGGHVMVAKGTSVDRGGQQWVYSNNPWPPNVGAQDMLTYSAYVSDTGYTHQNDAYNITDTHVCNSDFHGMPAGSFQACFNYQWQRARHAVTLSAYNSGGSTLMAGSFQGVPDRPVRSLMTAAQFQSYFTSYSAQGWRPDSVSVVQTAAGPRFTAIWVPANDGPFQTYFGMTDASFSSTFNSLAGQGYVLTDLFGYNDGGARYVATWVKKASAGYVAYINMTGAQYNSHFSDLAAQGFQPVRFSAYPGGGGTVYAAVWHKKANPFYMYFAMSPATYQSNYNTVTALGYRLTQISALNGTLAAIWNK